VKTFIIVGITTITLGFYRRSTSHYYCDRWHHRNVFVPIPCFS